jgi:hypothetical protein
MCTSTLSRQAEAMANSAFQVAVSDICTLQKANGGFHHLYMTWILAADTNGNFRPRMRWLLE